MVQARPVKAKTTSVRPFAKEMMRLKSLMRSMAANAWAIGDLVNEVKAAGVSVQDQAAVVGASRQRLSEMRRTAAAYSVGQRRLDVDFHFYTVAMRSARRLGLSPAAVLDDLVARRIDSTRAATRYLADRIRRREATLAADKSISIALAQSGLLNRCHHADYRDILLKIKRSSVKLIVADPPYGRYGNYSDGAHTRVAAAARDCDGMDDQSARALTTDLFRVAKLLLAEDGCLLLFRPGGLADPRWLLESAEKHGWECRHALTWRRGSAKLADGRKPYTSMTERILVYARPGAVLLNHDGSSCGDILEVKARRKSYAALDQHLFEKPVELMELLIGKHTYPGEVVVEPFGGTGPVARAAICMQRRWVYIESNKQNYALGCNLIARGPKGQREAAS